MRLAAAPQLAMQVCRIVLSRDALASSMGLPFSGMCYVVCIFPVEISGTGNESFDIAQLFHRKGQQ